MRLKTFALAVALTLAGGGTAHAAAWTRVTDPSLNIMRPGLTRTPGGVLHIAFAQGDIVEHVALSADGRHVSAASPIATYSSALNQSVARPAAGGPARVLRRPRQPGRRGRRDVGVGGRHYVVARRARLGRQAGVRRAGPRGRARQGRRRAVDLGRLDAGRRRADAGGADQELPGGLKGDPGAGVDAATGQAVVAWNLLDGSGVVALPCRRRARHAPRIRAPQLQHPVGVTGRLGAPGVVVAYTRGDNEFTGTPALYRVDTGATLALSRRPGQDVGVAAAPEGRVWAFWKYGATVFATRSNKAATRLEPVQAIKAPGDVVFDLEGEGSSGPLDVLALLEADYHHRVRPALTLTRSGRTFKVTDAGDPVKGAKVARGGVTRTTGANGTVKLPRATGRARAPPRPGSCPPPADQHIRRRKPPRSCVGWIS